MRKKVLIVDDNNDCRELVVIQLQRMACQAIEAATGEDALRQAKAEKPDLVIMDLGLPDMSGVEAVFRLKEDSETRHIPVVAFSAWGEDIYKARARRAGIEAFLTKPTPSKVFRQVIQNILLRDSSIEASFEDPPG